MTTRNNNTTRRGFLGAALAGAAPLAIVGAVGAAPATPATASPHHPQRSKDRLCDCLDCRERDRRWSDHPLVIAALVATRQALDALESVEQEDGDESRDAGAVHYALESWYVSVEGFVSGGGTAIRRHARQPHPDATTPEAAAVLALYDCLDALLDLTAGHDHRDGADCHICDNADYCIYFVRLGIDLLSGSGIAWPHFLGVMERELISDRRKVERERRRIAERREFGPNASAEHHNPEAAIEQLEELIGLYRRKLARRGKAVRRGGRHTS